MQLLRFLGRNGRWARTLAMTLSIWGVLVRGAWAAPETDFWRWFQQNETALYNFESDEARVFGLLAAELHKVGPTLTFEFGPQHDGRRNFVISADGIQEAFPKVESLFATAPTLPRWNFVKFRPRRPPRNLTFAGLTVAASSVSVLVRPNAAKVDLTVLIPGYSESADLAFTSIALLFLDRALGEYDTETRVGEIKVQAPLPAPIGALTLQELPAAVDAAFTRH